MKNFKCKWTLLSLAVTLLAFSSCKKDDDDDKVDLTAKVDVYVTSKKIGDAIKYAPVYTVTANKKLKSASVKTPGTSGKTISLILGSTASEFVKNPTDADFSATMPAKGEYTFTIKSEDSADKELTKKDALEDKKLTKEVAIKEAKYASNKETIKWDLVTDADKYMVKLYDSKGKVLFKSDFLAKTIKEYSFGTSTKGWSSTKAEKGKPYKIELCAIKLETGKTTTDDFQFMEFAEKTIKWEE